MSIESSEESGQTAAAAASALLPQTPAASGQSLEALHPPLAGDLSATHDIGTAIASEFLGGRPSTMCPETITELTCYRISPETIINQRCPTYQLHFPPKRCKWGSQNPKSGWAGKFRKSQVSVEFPQKPSVCVIPGSSFWGPHFGILGGFSGANEKG